MTRETRVARGRLAGSEGDSTRAALSEARHAAHDPRSQATAIRSTVRYTRPTIAKPQRGRIRRCTHVVVGRVAVVATAVATAGATVAAVMVAAVMAVEGTRGRRRRR